jgi:hypothetical protein
MKRLRPQSLEASASSSSSMAAPPPPRSRPRVVEATREALVASASSGDLTMLRSKLRDGVDMSFDDCVLIRTAISKNRKEVIVFLVREAQIPLNHRLSMQNRPLLVAVRAHKWQCVRLLLVLGSEYRDLLEYAGLLQLKESEIKKFKSLIQGFRENYLLRSIGVLKDFTESNANVSGLIMSFLYPQEFKAGQNHTLSVLE